MGYQALARQYRPQNFKELVGQEHVSQALMNGLEQNRIHHAFLFTGTRGVGKTTIARILAKALNCETGVTGNPCGTCSSCKEISEGRFVDLVEVDAASRTGVDDTRELLENVQYAPTKGRYKIYLIDEVHMFSNSSFNALLKTLEEPPPHVKFLLATTEPKKLPVTVLSRCLQFNLKRLNLPQIQNHLEKLLNLQKVEFDHNATELIARAADGSMRDGLSLLDQSLAFGAGKINENDVKLMLGTMDQESLVGLLNCIVDQKPDMLSAQLKAVFTMSPDYAIFLDEMALFLHEISLFQILNSYVDNSQFSRQSIKEFVNKTNPEQVQLYYQIVLKGQEEINLAPDTKTGFEMTIIRLFAFKFGEPLNNNITSSGAGKKMNNDANPVAASVDNNLKNQLDNTSQVAIAEKPTQNSTPIDADNKPLFSASEIIQENWDKVFPSLHLKGMAKELARNANVISNNQSIIVFGIDKQAQSFAMTATQNALIKAVENCCKDPITVKIDLDAAVTTCVAKKQRIMQNHSENQTKQKVSESPFVQHMQGNFDAQVIQIKDGQNFLEV